ncbi:hypothetical protein PSP6_390006 [Paraburkholderia tropica]|nr:hypothetical protein PSP6_390006 [Paraburkholderia tropica]
MSIPGCRRPGRSASIRHAGKISDFQLPDMILYRPGIIRFVVHFISHKPPCARALANWPADELTRRRVRESYLVFLARRICLAFASSSFRFLLACLFSAVAPARALCELSR